MPNGTTHEDLIVFVKSHNTGQNTDWIDLHRSIKSIFSGGWRIESQDNPILFIYRIPAQNFIS